LGQRTGQHRDRRRIPGLPAGDERGYLRPLDDGRDAGAVEAGALDHVFADGFD
jgi:hypothetical protein